MTVVSGTVSGSESCGKAVCQGGVVVLERRVAKVATYGEVERRSEEVSMLKRLVRHYASKAGNGSWTNFWKGMAPIKECVQVFQKAY